LRVWTCLIGPRRRFANRVLENLSFGLSAAAAVLATKRPDVLLARILANHFKVLIMSAAKLRGIKVIKLHKDVYPEAAIAAGILSKESRLTLL
jgi:hypothetical protein